ncbi:MAG TPA: bifunctional (p)ppGpp synthetase/guanosine-3',5'-bis(diphosphate) 3'-pyrophosphohydrolase [Acidimicrobiales bacterium]|nr:bifunctional (p)ppGpp synthetase/guanosine-3',5'-bis(diphosphate) 3'-pyrophosphohydrolase [Acidimicrobiales bacterium]
MAIDPLVAASVAEDAKGSDLPAQVDISGLFGAVAAYHPDSGHEMVTKAVMLAAKAHRGQTRLTGDPYVAHSIAVAQIVAELGLDETSVVSALLHDVVEDTDVTLAELSRDFGPTVAAIVDGVTKIDRLSFSSKEAQQAATVRKMLVAMAKDWRVLVIKLADRLHNMRTLSVMAEWKQERTAQQTLDIYAPLAHRLGIESVKRELEDLSFAAMYPRRYAEIVKMVETRAPRRDVELDQVVDVLRGRFAALGIEAQITGRPKHLWSIYEKMVVRGKEFDEIYDLVGIRIVVDEETDCWTAMGSVHALWPPVQGRFKDYINSPKFNMYQSLHTTVVGPRGKPLEIQIRTHEMHRRAEHGIAAHWEYKESASKENGAELVEDMAWLRRIVELDRDTDDPVEFLENLKLDLEQDEVYVFTPKGAIITLPTGATPVDFAYAIHTEVGHHCVGARVNGRLVSLDKVLSSGDTVEIFTSKAQTAAPSRDWLNIAVSSRAKNKIRQWFTRERREDAIAAGHEELLKMLRREGMSAQQLVNSDELLKISIELGFDDLDFLYASIGEGHTSAQTVVQHLERDLRGGEVQLPSTVFQSRRSTRVVEGSGVYVEGLDDVMVTLARCCTPVPGDAIIGFVTRGRGVSVHRDGCINALSLAGESRERLIEVEWIDARKGVFIAGIEVKAIGRSQVFAEVARVLGEFQVRIISSSTQTAEDRVTRMRFECELSDVEHLESVLNALRQLDGVYDAYRLLPGGDRTSTASTK